ncbi:MAG: sn-glycerol-3-phosphate ABC transporter ATP-binding protein UgpC [Thermodesulfobacteriota bacterium]
MARPLWPADSNQPPLSAMTQLILEQISKSFPDQGQILKEINLEVAEGEFVVLVGPSGCGKSTILRIIAGLETPSSGQVILAGRNLAGVSARERDMAMVFQNYALYPHMTVFDNLAFALKMARTPRAQIRERVRHTAAILGLEDLLKRRSKSLSGGQQQRVALGRAIIREPALFLFDEPLSNLDAKLRVAMRAELIRLHRRLAATMLYVTHDQVEAMSMGSRLVVLNQGRIQQIGTPLAIYDRPGNRFVASFLGSPAMNFFQARVVEQDNRVELLVGDQRLALPAAKGRRLLASSGNLPERQVTLGLRPEHITEPGGAARLPCLEFKVDFLEPLGNEVLASCLLDGQPCTSRLAPHTAIRADSRVSLAVDMNQAHFFHPQTEEALL